MKQILCFGDSNTWGYDGESRERLPWGVRWTSLLQEKLNKEEYRVIEEGLCGRTTVFEDPLRDGRKGTALLPTLLETHAQVEVITLMLGTNDCKTVFGASADVIGKGIIRLLDQVQEYACCHAKNWLLWMQQEEQKRSHTKHRQWKRLRLPLKERKHMPESNRKKESMRSL